MLTIHSLLVKSEQALLNRVLPQLFGYYVIHCGHSAMNTLPLQTSPILQQFYVSHSDHDMTTQHKPDVIADYAELPFKVNSLDVVVLQHALEYCPDPKLVLQSLWHQLIAGGHLVIVGYNPYSLFGLWQYFRKTAKSRERLLALPQLRHQLIQLNYEIVQEYTDFFRPPLTQSNYLHLLRFLEPIGATICPSQGAVYVLVAKKQMNSLTPIKPVWARQFFATPLTTQHQPATQSLHNDTINH